MAVPGRDVWQASTQESGDLISIIERPIQFRARIDPAQDRDSQPITFGQNLALGDIHQLHQQSMLDERHQYTFGNFTKMTTQGAEQLAFRRHGR